jgi:hypothetical protein
MELKARHFKREKPKQFESSSFKPKGNFVKRRAPSPKNPKISRLGQK